MCDLRPWRLGLPGWVPKSLVSPLHLKFSCRIWDTSSWHWIPLGSTSLTGSDTPSHSVTPPPTIPHTPRIQPLGSVFVSQAAVATGLPCPLKPIQSSLCF